MTGSPLLDDVSIPQLLAANARRRPRHVYARDQQGRDVTTAELAERVRGYVDALAASGVTPRSRVAVSLPNSLDHIALILALLELGALWVPVNVAASGTPLEHILADSAATHTVVLDGSPVHVAGIRAHAAVHGTEPTAAGTLPAGDRVDGGAGIRLQACAGQPTGELPDTVALMYTSGTTGPPKGVQVTDTMLRASAHGSLRAAAAGAGAVFYLWEPLFHIGGAQMSLTPLLADVGLALGERFRASRFWQQVSDTGATHIHHLGGILQMLLRQPPRDCDRGHGVRVAWGAGASPAVRRECEYRFGLEVHECYGMTETSSVVCVSHGDPDGGVGAPLPWFEVEIDGSADSPNGIGEILVRGREPGLVTPGYLGHPSPNRAAADWFRTGDQGRFDSAGNLHFVGRANDTIRVRGENVSAWQVESVFAAHPDVAACAAVGVSADVGEQEILLCLTPATDRGVNPRQLLNWASEHLPRYQRPRYIKVLPELPLTPSQRVAKKRLPTDTDDAFDATA